MNEPEIDLVERLGSTHGAMHNIGRLLLWSTHVEAVIAIITEAAADLSRPENLVPFMRPGWWRDKKRRNVHGDNVRIPNEDAVTDALVERIKQIKVQPRPRSAIIANSVISFHAQGRRSVQERIGPLGLKDTDITAYKFDCQSASDRDPGSACKRDPHLGLW